MTQAPVARREPKLSVLNIYRGIAAIAVVGLHAVPMIGPWRPASGYLAVDLFFLISGIVISQSYDEKIGSGVIGRSRFMKLRLIRFYPVYALGAVAAFAVLLAGSHLGHVRGFSDIGSMTAALAFTLAFLPHKIGDYETIFTINAPYWSLFFELVVNAVFILLWPILHGWRLVMTVAGCALGLAATGYAIGGLEGGHSWDTFEVGVARVGFSFFAGVLIARTVPRSTRPSGLALAVTCAMLVAVFCFDPGTWRMGYDFACALVIFPLFGMMAMRFEVGRLGGPIAEYLGDSSYAVYALHMPAIGAALGLLGVIGLRDSLPQPLSFIIFALALIVGALLVHHWIDVPIRRRLSRML